MIERNGDKMSFIPSLIAISKLKLVASNGRSCIQDHGVYSWNRWFRNSMHRHKSGTHSQIVCSVHQTNCCFVTYYRLSLAAPKRTAPDSSEWNISISKVGGFADTICAPVSPYSICENGKCNTSFEIQCLFDGTHFHFWAIRFKLHLLANFEHLEREETR